MDQELNQACLLNTLEWEACHEKKQNNFGQNISEPLLALQMSGLTLNYFNQYIQHLQTVLNNSDFSCG